MKPHAPARLCLIACPAHARAADVDYGIKVEISLRFAIRKRDKSGASPRRTARHDRGA